MARSNNQKAKILYLERMLRTTGENRTMTMQEIIGKLSEYGISAERKSIYDDMEVLRSFGLDVKYRRERPGGYYVAGQTAEEPSAVKKEEPEKTSGKVQESREAQEPRTAQEPAPDRESWKKMDGACRNTKKSLKLLCETGIRKKVEAYFGKDGEYKDKAPGYFTVSAPLLEGPAFYGWLAAQGKKVHILKPKKAAQTYRDYLKMLAKEYKG